MVDRKKERNTFVPLSLADLISKRSQLPDYLLLKASHYPSFSLPKSVWRTFKHRLFMYVLVCVCVSQRATVWHTRMSGCTTNTTTHAHTHTHTTMSYDSEPGFNYTSDMISSSISLTLFLYPSLHLSSSPINWQSSTSQSSFSRYQMQGIWPSTSGTLQNSGRERRRG